MHGTESSPGSLWSPSDCRALRSLENNQIQDSEIGGLAEGLKTNAKLEWLGCAHACQRWLLVTADARHIVGFCTASRRTRSATQAPPSWRKPSTPTRAS